MELNATLGTITFHPPANPHFIKSARVSFVDRQGREQLVIEDFQIGKSRYDNGAPYVCLPASFVHTCSPDGTSRSELRRPIHFDPDTWRELSRIILDAFGKWQREQGGQQ